MFFDPRRLKETPDHPDDVLLVLPAEWSALHPEPPFTEISDTLEYQHPVRVTLVFNGSPEERASGVHLRCFIDPQGRVTQFNLGHPYRGQHTRFRALASTIDYLSTSYYKRVLDPEGP